MTPMPREGWERAGLWPSGLGDFRDLPVGQGGQSLQSSMCWNKSPQSGRISINLSMGGEWLEARETCGIHASHNTEPVRAVHAAWVGRGGGA